MIESSIQADATAPEHVDVLIVGAGISGIGAAYHLTQQCPDLSFLVLEALESFGGTWWTHKYPGVRSDSDMFTFGYRFKPWTGAPIAAGSEILRYLGEVIEENGLARYIRYRHRVLSASWSTEGQKWSVELICTDSGQRRIITAGFLWMCQGYYRHGKGYTPRWPGMARFHGLVVHPQQWPADLDYAGKRLIVIGSGATAATLIPSLARDAALVTMLQRSPTFYFVGPNRNELADMLRQLGIPEAWIHEIVRRKIIQEQSDVTRMTIDRPDVGRRFLLDKIRPLLPAGFDIDKHFNPKYRPWQQRIAFLPAGDLFANIRSGKASVVTDELEAFTETGIALKSGATLAADIIITATGFEPNVLGDVHFVIDGSPLDPTALVTYRGILLTGVPNLALVYGYFRSSWTLRVDLIGDFVCRLLQHSRRRGASMVVPKLRPEDADMALGPWVDPENFNPSYLARSVPFMPKQGSRPPWQLPFDYLLERDELPAADLDDPCLVYSSHPIAARPTHSLDAGEFPPIAELRASPVL